MQKYEPFLKELEQKLHDKDAVSLIEDNFDGILKKFLDSEFLHQIFWPELVGIDGAKLEIINALDEEAYLFLIHEILSQECIHLENRGAFSEMGEIGGILFGYEDRDWIVVRSYIDKSRFDNYIANGTVKLLESIEDFGVVSFEDLYLVGLYFLMQIEENNYC
jgi:hypothetical protein